MNILQLSDCSKRQLASNQPTTNVSFIQPFCGSIRCSAYLIPALGSFITFLSSVFLAGTTEQFLLSNKNFYHSSC